MLSTTVSSGNTCRPSGTSMSPARAERFAVKVVMSRPASRTLPLSARWSPVTVRIRVDFPAPFAPSTAAISPSRRSSAISSRTGAAP